MTNSIETIVEGITVTGQIIHRSEADMSIVITSPYSGYCTGSHIPIGKVCMDRWLWEQLTGTPYPVS